MSDVNLAAAKPLTMREEHHEADEKTLFGFWMYLMTDCVLFATLFAVYAVMRTNTNGGEAGGQLFSLPYVLAETLILLTSSFTSGLAMLSVRKRSRGQTLLWFGITFALGVAFLALELLEFHHLGTEGNSWRRSGFLSSYFTLVGTHGLHITAGLIWMIVLAGQLKNRGVTRHVARRANLLGMFWHFLDIIWIFIFTIVYMLGAIQS